MTSDDGYVCLSPPKFTIVETKRRCYFVGSIAHKARGGILPFHRAYRAYRAIACLPCTEPDGKIVPDSLYMAAKIVVVVDFSPCSLRCRGHEVGGSPNKPRRRLYPHTIQSYEQRFRRHE